MEKKHISILGSCCSRDLFDLHLLERIFCVDTYGFQLCVFDLFDENGGRKQGLNIDPKVIYKAKTEEFTVRCCCHELNKSIINEFEKSKSEYFMIDLHTIFSEIVKVTYNNNFVYTQSSMNRIKNFQKNIINDDITELSTMTFETIPFDSFDKNIIKLGLENLASWAKKNYAENKIIINLNKRTKKYVSNDEILSYPQETIKKDQQNQNIVDHFTMLLKSFLPNSIFGENKNEFISRYRIYDRRDHGILPPSSHFLTINHFDNALNLLSLLNIDWRDYLIDNEKSIYNNPYTFELEHIYIDLDNELLNNKNLKYKIPNLNSYFDKLGNLEDFIIIISTKDESAMMLKYFRRKAMLGLDMNINFRDSYIAVVDKSRNFVYENNSRNTITYTYVVDQIPVAEILSSGWYAGGGASSIIVKNVECSLNLRGLNIVILDSKSFKKIDAFNVDSYKDKDLFLNK